MIDANKTLERLLVAIRAAAEQPSLEWARPPERLTGGFWAEMWRIRLAEADSSLDRELVARVMPNAEIAARETMVQSHLADAGYPTPRVRLAAGPEPELDRAWMVMDLADGQPLLADLSGPAGVARLPQFARSLPDRLAQHAATLHAIDPGSLYDGTDDAAALLTRLQVQTNSIGRDDLAHSAKWLQQNRPIGDSRGSPSCTPFEFSTRLPPGARRTSWTTIQAIPTSASRRPSPADSSAEVTDRRTRVRTNRLKFGARAL